MTWEEYCIKKKIDSKAFKAAEENRWQELKGLFEQVHPNSFTEQKKFIINDLRRKYLLVNIEEQEKSKPPVAKPIVKIPKKS